jgi:hypothetical protein
LEGCIRRAEQLHEDTSSVAFTFGSLVATIAAGSGPACADLDNLPVNGEDGELDGDAC